MARDQAPTNEIDFGDGLTPEAGSQLTVLDAVGAEALTVPGGTMLLTADFSREGPDLLLTGDGGEEVLVRDYFSVETSPNLLTDGGAQITPQVAQALSGSLAPDQYAQATTTDGDAQPIGTVDTADGDVFAIRTDGTRVDLEVGDPVFQGDVIETGDIRRVGADLRRTAPSSRWTKAPAWCLTRWSTTRVRAKARPRSPWSRACSRLSVARSRSPAPTP